MDGWRQRYDPAQAGVGDVSSRQTLAEAVLISARPGGRTWRSRAVFFAVTQEIKDIPDERKTWWHRLSILLSPLFKLDFLALISPMIKSLLVRVMKMVRREPGEIPRLGVGTLARAMAWHFAGRVLLMAELAGFLLLLTHQAAQPSTLIILAGFTGLLGQVFFMIPQGLGVNEMGITGIMMLMGTGETLGMALAILRRGRMVFWAVAGLGIFAAAQGAALLRRLNAALLPSPKPY